MRWVWVTSSGTQNSPCLSHLEHCYTTRIPCFSLSSLQIMLSKRQLKLWNKSLPNTHTQLVLQMPIYAGILGKSLVKLKLEIYIKSCIIQFWSLEIVSGNVKQARRLCSRILQKGREIYLCENKKTGGFLCFGVNSCKSNGGH